MVFLSLVVFRCHDDYEATGLGMWEGMDFLSGLGRQQSGSQDSLLGAVEAVSVGCRLQELERVGERVG